MITPLALTFYGGTPTDYLHFMERIFSVGSYVASIDVAPNIPRIRGEANIKEFQNFVPKFYYTFSRTGKVGAFRGSFFNPLLSGSSNNYVSFNWCSDFLNNTPTKDIDHHISISKETGLVAADGKFKLDQLLTYLFPSAKFKQSAFTSMTLLVDIRTAPVLDVVKALGVVSDTNIKISGDDVQVLPSAGLIRQRLKSTFEEYGGYEEEFFSQIRAFDHECLMSFSDTQLTQVYLGEPVKFMLNDERLLGRLEHVLSFWNDQAIKPSIDIFDLFKNRLPEPITVTFSSFRGGAHKFFANVNGKRTAINF